MTITQENHATPPLILASSSRYRADLLKRLGLTFSQISPDINENPRAGETPEKLAWRLATEKARAVATKHPGSLVIGSDQVASLDGIALGKPGTAIKARRQLSLCSGKSVHFYTGLCLAGPNIGQQSTLVDTFIVHFRKLGADQISRYIEKEQPLDCAGSFKMEGLGISLFERLEGKDPNSLIGLPLIDLLSLLNQRYGFAIP